MVMKVVAADANTVVMRSYEKKMYYLLYCEITLLPIHKYEGGHMKNL